MYTFNLYLCYMYIHKEAVGSSLCTRFVGDSGKNGSSNESDKM